MRIATSSGSIADSTLFLGSAFVAPVGPGAFVVAVEELADLAGDKGSGLAIAEAVAGEKDTELAAAGSNLIQAEVDRRRTYVVAVPCRTEFDTVPELAVVAVENLAAAAEAYIHPFAALGQCSSFPFHPPRPLAQAPMQCLDTCLLAACWLASIDWRRKSKRWPFSPQAFDRNT